MPLRILSMLRSKSRRIRSAISEEENSSVVMVVVVAIDLCLLRLALGVVPRVAFSTASAGAVPGGGADADFADVATLGRLLRVARLVVGAGLAGRFGLL